MILDIDKNRYYYDIVYMCSEDIVVPTIYFSLIKFEEI